jgi:hypothetical protein
VKSISDYPANVAELIAHLRVIAAREPRTKEELRALERECVSLAFHTQRSSLSSGVPEVVWHFLSDADIRFKDPEYAQVQTASLVSALAKMEQQGAA